MSFLIAFVEATGIIYRIQIMTKCLKTVQLDHYSFCCVMESIRSTVVVRALLVLVLTVLVIVK